MLDSWTQEVRGRKYFVEIMEDYETTPSDYELYSRRQEEAWANGEWSFCGVSVTPDLPGLDPKQFPASLWGIEWGNLPEYEDGSEGYVDTEAYVRAYIVPELAERIWRDYHGEMLELRALLSQALYERTR